MIRTDFPTVPGLFVYSNYFPPPQRSRVLAESLRIANVLNNVIADGAELTKVGIPQPGFVRSAKHNLQSEEQFTRVTLSEPAGRDIRGEFFPRYGEDGHALCYFQGNDNLPDFVHGELLDGIRQTIEAEKLVAPGQPLKWKLTMNFYRNVGGVVAGFPFHVDIPSNGVVTMILNVQREALFQIARGETLKDVPLRVGALLVLSGESRYEWKHRVLPMSGGTGGGLERVSLVLGFA
jgi:hypothetical protein